MSNRQSFSFETHIRAHVEAWIPPEPAFCLFAYHGYAESATAPLDALLAAGMEDALLLAPFAPHHFYNRRGEVVGSWMTRFEREQRIAELIAQARGLWRSLSEPQRRLPLFVFGFSQGGANAYRVALLAELPIRRCFVLGADQPPEAGRLEASESSPALTLLCGKEDDAAVRDAMENDHRSLGERGYNVEHLSLQGGHEYLPDALVLLRMRVFEDLAASGGPGPGEGPRS